LPFKRLCRSHSPLTLFETDPSWITRFSLVIGRIPEKSVISTLDDVIDIDYSFVDVSDYDTYQAFSPFVEHQKKHKQFFLMTSRGCPFECTFCSNSKIHGRKMRFASVDKIVSHVRYLVEHYGMNVLTMYDDQLLIDMPRAKELFYQLAPFKLRIECPNGLSASFIDKEMARRMRLVGMDTVYLAIESGSQYVLSTLMHKSLKLSQMKSAVEALQENDIFVLGFFVMGMPGETSEHRQETCQFIKDVGLDWASLQMATPFKGSKLYDMCIKNNWINKDTLKEVYKKSGGIFMETVINIPGIDSQEINREVYEMNLDVNFHNNHRMKIGDYQTAARCFEEVLRRYPKHEWAKNYLNICNKIRRREQ
jgi:anaerobic magnesium-protoporphyrin IX monomethyl ester cyclase